MTNFLSKLNPFYKLCALLVISTTLTFIHSFWINLWVFLASLFLLVLGARPAVWLRALRILLPASVFAISIFISGLVFGSDSPGHFGRISLDSTQSGLNMAIRLYSFLGLGLLFSLTTDSYALIKSLQTHAKLPRKFAYGILAAIHLLPLLKTELKQARLAFAVRGVRLHVFSLRPLFTMLVQIFRWSDTLSIAMASRGFSNEIPSNPLQNPHD